MNQSHIPSDSSPSGVRAFPSPAGKGTHAILARASNRDKNQRDNSIQPGAEYSIKSARTKSARAERIIRTLIEIRSGNPPFQFRDKGLGSALHVTEGPDPVFGCVQQDDRWETFNIILLG